ncbi:hypothetical protein [Dactylosporangium sp. NPDC049140]|uniref:hypothetical protein n=1 Tax=Dactylosporangium sp. NPDC049140 TaxID=3155647 RepID=UPI0033D19B04
MSDGNVTPPDGLWAPRWLLPPIAVFTAYGIARIFAVVWGIVRDGPPSSLLTGTDLVSDAAAAVQGVAVAVVLAVPRLRRPPLAWIVGLVAVGVAIAGATVWVLLGASDPPRRVRQLLLALALTILMLIICGFWPRWTAGTTGGIDLARVRRALNAWAWAAGASAVVGGLVIVTADPAGAVGRLAVLCLQLGGYSSFLAILTTLVVIGEQRRLIRDEGSRELYQHLTDHHRQRRDEPDR